MRNKAIYNYVWSQIWLYDMCANIKGHIHMMRYLFIHIHSNMIEVLYRDSYNFICLLIIINYYISIQKAKTGGWRTASVKMQHLGSPSFLHKPILYPFGPTQRIQHTIVHPRSYCSTSVVLRGAVMYHTRNRSNTQRFCTRFDTACGDSAQPPIQHKPIPHLPDSAQPVSKHHFFSTKLVLHHHSPFLHTNIF